MQDFRSALLIDGTPKTLKESISQFVNGITLLATTASALESLLDSASETINFDRCCHLILDNADILLQDYGNSLVKIFSKYQLSVKKFSNRAEHGYFVPRQVLYWQIVLMDSSRN